MLLAQPGHLDRLEDALVDWVGGIGGEAGELLDYAPLSYGKGGSRPYYAVIDNAIRAAAARGVTIKLMVSNWNTEQPAIAYLKSL